MKFNNIIVIPSQWPGPYSEAPSHSKMPACQGSVEYGTAEGIITLHNVVENIMGDLPALEDEDEDEKIGINTIWVLLCISLLLKNLIK
jgi:hypothetical protein